LLVIGAQPESLGAWIREIAAAGDWKVTTAGISGYEDIEFDITSWRQSRRFFNGEPWHSIVCTAAINLEGPITSEELHHTIMSQMAVNAVGIMDLCHWWADWWLNNLDETFMNPGIEPEDVTPIYPLHFVAVSSNSSHIARRNAVGYCMSKAALSMGIRCAARDLGNTWLNVYGYEPGWLSGTPMSKAVEARLGDKPTNRIPGNRTVDPAALAHMIVRNLNNPFSSLNGCMLRLDGGEQ
jgi:NAD(P)-dependent dehydrogenase (short-subunit alcohol dehydrogenase family)